MFTKENLSSTERTGAVHGILLTQPSETRFTEYVATRIHLERFMKHVETNWTNKIVIYLGQLWFTIQKFLELKRIHYKDNSIVKEQTCILSLFCLLMSLCVCFDTKSLFLLLRLIFSFCLLDL